jgi:hypothetical protein
MGLVAENFPDKFYNKNLEAFAVTESNKLL